jgi:hypothetical protein
MNQAHTQESYLQKKRDCPRAPKKKGPAPLFCSKKVGPQLCKFCRSDPIVSEKLLPLQR